MKKYLNILALVVVGLTMALATAADAQGYKLNVLGRLRWNKQATTDSTEIAVSWSPTNDAGTDTTEWVDLRGYTYPNIANGQSTAATLVAIQLNAQQAASGDTMRVQFQFANEATVSGRTITATKINSQSAVVQVGNQAPVITVLDVDDAHISNFFRVIFDNHDQSVGVTRKVSVIPIVKVLAR